MDNHPTINLVSTPPIDCINPVKNCIQYCFKANDYESVAGSIAIWSISWSDPSNYADGIPIEIAGKNFQTGTPTDQNQFSWTDGPPLTIAQIRDNCYQMLTANFAFHQEYLLQKVSAVGIEAILAFAREDGLKNPFTFSFPVAIPPLVFQLNGIDAVYLQDYLVIIEIWECATSGELIELISSNGYQPNPETLEFCIDISRNMSSLVETTWPGLIIDTDVPVEDETICKHICLRYGQVYNTGVTNCDVTPQYFEQASPIKIINAAFQKPQEVAYINSGTPMMDEWCYQGTPTRFLTDYPQSLKVCKDACFWLWYNFDADLSGFSNPTVWAFYRLYYTDGTNTPAIQASAPLTQHGCWTIPAGECQLDFLLTPGKTIEAIESAIVILSDFINVQISETFRLEVDQSSCCCKEFYFLNEKGGFDTIALNCEQDIDLELSSSEVCGFENCEGDILKGGKAEADRRAFEVFTVFTRFNDDYMDLDWFRQFLKSPIKYIREGTEVYKIKLLTDSATLFTYQEKIFLELEYVLSFELNTQDS